VCGISAFFGFRAPLYIYRLLIELQHRGQESAGISVLRNGKLFTAVKKGYVIEAFNPSDLALADVYAAIGHVRYSTTGGYMDAGGQPIEVGLKPRMAVAFNGNIINYRELSRRLRIEKPMTDTEVLAQLISVLTAENGGDVVEAVRELPYYVVGSYSIAILTSEPRIVVARDPKGFKPLSYSCSDRWFVAASETAALDGVGVDLWHEVQPGEVVSFDGYSLEKTEAHLTDTPTPCVFEYVYFSRPDSYFNGVQVHVARVRMGEALAANAPVAADVVIPVPDSGRSSALGFSRASGVPMDEGLMRNRYVGRSFIMPPGLREALSSMKYGVVRDVVRGRRVVLVDDSLIRGTTMRSIVLLLRRYGAGEVHVRIASPPVRYPCFMGIDFPTRRELIASRLKDPVRIAEVLHADSLAYNTLEAMVDSVGIRPLCTACFSGTYPFKNLNIDQLESIFSR